MLLADDISKKTISALVQEISFMQSLQHENIVRYYGVQRLDPYIYIFMEYMSGGSIAKLLVSFDSFPESVIRNYTKQILMGLEYLHYNMIVHRDIKGANILVKQNSRIKLADFGCSKIYEGMSSGLLLCYLSIASPSTLLSHV